MAKETERFESDRHGWAERANLGELDGVLSVGASDRKTLLLHSVGLFAAMMAQALSTRRRGQRRVLLDFGCGNGRMLRFFSKKGWSVFGTEITAEMLAQARKLGLPDGSAVAITDGVSIPLSDGSVDLVWICGVLKYSLFAPGCLCRGGDGVLTIESFTPAYEEIAQEIYRVLKPGGFVVNVEMYVDKSTDNFTHGFEKVGFVTKQERVLRKHEGSLEKVLQWRDWRRLPRKIVLASGLFCTAFRYCFDDPQRVDRGFRDYLFVWFKPR